MPSNRILSKVRKLDFVLLLGTRRATVSEVFALPLICALHCINQKYFSVFLSGGIALLFPEINQHLAFSVHLLADSKRVYKLKMGAISIHYDISYTMVKEGVSGFYDSLISDSCFTLLSLFLQQ